MVRPWQGEIEGTLAVRRGSGGVPQGIELAALRDQIDRQACELSDLRWELAYLRARYSGFRFQAVDRLNDLLWKVPFVHRLIKSGALTASRVLQWLGIGEHSEAGPAGGQAVVFSEGLSAEQSARILSAAHSKPLISIIVPVYKVAPRWLQRCLASVIDQHYDHWELLAVDDGSQSPALTEMLRTHAAADSRIRFRTLDKNGGICVATNAGLEMARGKFVGFLDHDDELTPDALAWVVAMHNRFPRAAWFYSDEDKIDEQGRLSVPYFKPDFSPEYLLSLMYTCHFSVYEAGLLRQLGGVRPWFEGSQDHDLALRASEQVTADQVVHIPRILYHWRTLQSSTASHVDVKPYASIAGCKAVREALTRRGLEGTVTPHPMSRTCYQIQFRPQRQPRVTVIVAARNAADDLSPCLSAVRQRTRYEDCEVRIVDASHRSQAFNDAVATVDSEYVVLMNQDVVIQSDDWLEQLVATAEIDRSIAGVGTLLLYPDGAVQHAGIILGINGTAEHSHRHFPADNPGCAYRVHLLNECFGAASDLLLVRRSAFLEVGGFDIERYPACYSDADLWLRLRRAGHRCLYNPQVRGIYHESPSQPAALADGATDRRFRDQWRPQLRRDPFYNPNLTLANAHYRGLRPYPVVDDFPEVLGAVTSRAA